MEGEGGEVRRQFFAGLLIIMRKCEEEKLGGLDESVTKNLRHFSWATDEAVATTLNEVRGGISDLSRGPKYAEVMSRPMAIYFTSLLRVRNPKRIQREVLTWQQYAEGWNGCYSGEDDTTEYEYLETHVTNIEDEELRHKAEGFRPQSFFDTVVAEGGRLNALAELPEGEAGDVGEAGDAGYLAEAVEGGRLSALAEVPEGEVTEGSIATATVTTDGDEADADENLVGRMERTIAGDEGYTHPIVIVGE